MKKPLSLRFALMCLAGSFVLFLFLTFWYSVSFEGEWPSTLADTPIGLAGVTIVMIMIITGPEEMRSRRQWRQFVWILPLTCIALGIAGYAITWWLYGNSLTTTVEIVHWSLLAAGTLIGLLIAWHKGRSFEWPEAWKH